MANTNGGNTESENDDGIVVPALPEDALGRPVLPVAQGYQDALEQGYYGNDGKDLGAAVSPEDVHSFDEAAARIDQPAHSEPKVVENTNLTAAGGYSGLSAPAPAPVEGDATQADAPSLGVTTPAPVEASSTGSTDTEGTVS